MMACIDPDGTLTVTGKFLLMSLVDGPLSTEEISANLKMPLFRARGSLREMADAGVIREEDGVFHLTDEGRAKL
jgi:predicted transcriptional regulator